MEATYLLPITCPFAKVDKEILMMIRITANFFMLFDFCLLCLLIRYCFVFNVCFNAFQFFRCLILKRGALYARNFYFVSEIIFEMKKYFKRGFITTCYIECYKATWYVHKLN